MHRLPWHLLDRGELVTLVPAVQDLLEEEQESHETVYTCPRCGSSPMERECGQQLSVQVDVYSLCSGIYLDDGELPKIKRFSDSLQAVFTPNRQASLQRKARRREALSAIYGTESPAAKESVSDRLLFIQNVYLLLAVTLAMTAVGSLFGIQSGLTLTLFCPALIFEVVVFLLLLGARRVPTLNLVLLFVYTFLSGFSLAAVLATYLAAGHAVIIWQAAGLTAATFVGLSIYVHVAKQDFTWMGGMLFISPFSPVSK